MEEEIIQVTAHGLKEDWKILASLSNSRMLIEKVDRQYQRIESSDSLVFLEQTIESRSLARADSKRWKKI